MRVDVAKRVRGAVLPVFAQGVHHHLPPGQKRAQADHELGHLQARPNLQHLRDIAQPGERKRYATPPSQLILNPSSYNY